jgi:hypothetical protein
MRLQKGKYTPAYEIAGELARYLKKMMQVVLPTWKSGTMSENSLPTSRMHSRRGFKRYFDVSVFQESRATRIVWLACRELIRMLFPVPGNTTGGLLDPFEGPALLVFVDIWD